MRKLAIFSLMGVFIIAGTPAWADFDAGLAAYKKNDFDTAIKEWRPLAEKGDAKSQYYLGSLYYYGFGVSQDYSKAIFWFKKASDQGESSAQLCMGLMCYNGQGMDLNPNQAAYWFRKAAEQGSAQAQHHLGHLCATGMSGKKDIVEGYMWFSLAADGNYKPAVVRRDEIAKQMTPQQLAEAQRLAREWKPDKTK